MASSRYSLIYHYGEFCIYLASVASRCPGNDAFLQLVKNESIKDIYVIQKSETVSQTNKNKTPALAGILSKELHKDIKCIDVPSYQAIVCDSNTNRVYITNEIIYRKSTSVFKVSSLPDSKPEKIDSSKAIPMEISKQGSGYFKIQTNTGRLSTNQIAPHETLDHLTFEPFSLTPNLR